LIVAVDARHLAGGRGVAHHTRGFLAALRARHPEDEWRAVTPRRSRLVFGSAALAGRPRLDRMAGGADVVWVPAPAPVAVSPDVPYVLTVHDLSWLERPRDFTAYERAWHAVARVERLARRAAAVVAVSEATRDAVRTRWGIDAEVVHPGVTVPAGPGEDPSLPDRFLLAVGALEPRKDPELLVRAHALARSRGLDADLVLAGDGRLAPRPAAPGVHVLGHVANVGPLYERALALLMPSHLEGFGFPPLEAALHGTPSILSDLPVFAETLGDAALRAPRDDDAWAEAMLRIARDEPLRRDLGKRARQAASRFSWDDAADRLHAILRSAAA
jgi:glycosyltransferase involved in cell wall biosynthesis